MVAYVQSWLGDPANNFGWLLQGNETEDRTAKRFDTKENPTEGNRPVLSIEFIPSQETPTPTSTPTATKTPSPTPTATATPMMNEIYLPLVFKSHP